MEGVYGLVVLGFICVALYVVNWYQNNSKDMKETLKGVGRPA